MSLKRERQQEDENDNPECSPQHKLSGSPEYDPPDYETSNKAVYRQEETCSSEEDEVAPKMKTKRRRIGKTFLQSRLKVIHYDNY